MPSIELMLSDGTGWRIERIARGLGSVPGALIGGLIIGLVEAMGTACFPDPSRGLAYKSAFGLVIFALLLLFRPTGLFGRKET